MATVIAGVTVNPSNRLDLEENERLKLLQRYLRDARIRPPKSARRLHAVIHVIVENQLAMTDEPVIRALSDLAISHPS